MLACHSRRPALDRPLTSFAPPCVCPGAARRITLGMLVQTSNSFNKVFSSLSIVSENWGGINEWRSTLVRLRQFESELYAAGGDADEALSDGPLLERDAGHAGSESDTEMLPMASGRAL